MSNVFEFKSKDEIEKLAIEHFDLQKKDNDTYYILETSFKSGSEECKEFERKVGKSEEYLEPEIIVALNELVDKEYDVISVKIDENISDKLKILRISNPINERQFKLQVNSQLDKGRRFCFAGLFANAITKQNVSILMYNTVTFNEIKELLRGKGLC